MAEKKTFSSLLPEIKAEIVEHVRIPHVKTQAETAGLRRANRRYYDPQT